ncbi:hypothetical protein T190820D02B_50247 [Tenacibaculum sp. 190524A05c]
MDTDPKKRKQVGLILPGVRAVLVVHVVVAVHVALAVAVVVAVLVADVEEIKYISQVKQ